MRVAARQQLTQAAQAALPPSSTVMKLDTGDIAARTVEAGDEASLDRVVPVAKTIGIVVVAALAATAAGVFVTITATGRRTKSATSVGSRSS